MSISLAEQNIVAQKRYSGSGDYTILAGESIKIEVSGNTILDTDVPAGKSWTTNITVSITEDDI